MKRLFLSLSLLFLLPALLAAGEKEEDLPPGLYAKITTNRGVMIFRLDYRRSPVTVTNFCGLAEGLLSNDDKAFGEPYYDSLEFYRDIPRYVVYTGDPQNDGTGGPGYSFPRETGSLISAAAAGVLVMDGFSTESHGSRFFITRSGDAFLDTKYTPFGQIVQGGNVLKKIRKGDHIESVVILRVGQEAQALDFGPASFTKLLEEARVKDLENLRVENPLLADTVVALGPERQKSPTGIYFVITAPGEEGTKPSPGDFVMVHYVGSLLDGTIFDSSLERGQTFDFVLGQDAVISSWVETIMDMTVGESRTILVPPSLAYGDQSFGPIPPNSWLRFEITLVSASS